MTFWGFLHWAFGDFWRGVATLIVSSCAVDGAVAIIRAFQGR